MKALIHVYGFCLSLALPIICLAAMPSSPDQALDTLDLLREETLTTFEMGELVPSHRERFGPISRTYEVTAKDILDQNARNVGEALRFVPGVIYGRGGMDNGGIDQHSWNWPPTRVIE